jgi:hypothetical protein
MAIPGVLPELSAAEDRLRALATAAGLAYTINREEHGGGYVRTEADTAAYMGYRDAEYPIYVRNLKAKNPKAIPLSKYQWRPISAFGSSYHNYGAAFDVTMTRGTFAQLGALAPRAGLRWGGDAGFVTAKRQDPPHFQLPVTLLEAKARWLTLGGTAGVVAKLATSPAVRAGVAAAGLALVVGLALMHRGAA